MKQPKCAPAWTQTEFDQIKKALFKYGANYDELEKAVPS